MGIQRIDNKFRQISDRGTPGIIPFVTVGFPDLDATLEIVPAMIDGGADIIELGVPFSDPLADGPTIQTSSLTALRNGVTVAKCLEVCSILRSQGVEAPIVLMGYINPLMKYGFTKLARDASVAGVDGFIVADLPVEESDDFREICLSEDICVIPLVAPTSSDKRISMVCDKASGFIYCVSVAGVTGAREELPVTLRGFVEKVRTFSALPLAVGFGISNHTQVKSLSAMSVSAVVGSALIEIIEQTPREGLVDSVRNFIYELRGSGDEKEL